MLLNPCDCMRHVQPWMTFFHLEKIKQKMSLLIHFIQHKLLYPALMELTVWGETDDNEIITQMNVESQRSGKDAVRAHSGTLSSQGGQGGLPESLESSLQEGLLSGQRGALREDHPVCSGGCTLDILPGAPHV